MAGHHLIEAYLDAVARQLPADAVDELADGLTETYLHHLSGGVDADAAAAAAVAEFGAPDQVVAAFVTQSIGRRVARVLLCSGPPMAVCWVIGLAAGHAWTWPVPPVLRLVFGLVLLAVAAGLGLAATGRSYRRTRVTGAAGLGLMALDIGMVTGVVLVAPAVSGPMAIAIVASLTRCALTARVLPRLLPRPLVR